jgi:hypothetical protein
VQATCNLNLREFESSYGFSASLFSNNFGSAYIGTRPILCAKFSSGIIDVFYHISTFSIAIVGISAIMILLKALASGGSTPISSKMISSSFSSLILTSELRIKCLIDCSSRVPV